ncbi:MAG: SulP family inorganic anion transporter [Chloroflexi bacterium HGW-Chloroflexi-8]|nr:MAG: SulP family inorganic anion transporter [Chloroflexi bacterium HGW-Chloroflexi-8]
MGRKSFPRMLRDEFTGYNGHKFQKDLLAGLTVAAVALPLALAFGVASGASAAAGLVTAIIAGLLIGFLSGAPYQISGPTGAMSAVLILLVQRYGLEGIWLAGILSGIFLLLIGLFRLGRFIAFIPAPVITGFTSGIALIIFIGQIDNFLGIKTPGAESTLLKFLEYFRGGFQISWQALLLGLLVILIMLFWPKQWQARFPSSLLGIIAATAVNALLHWPVAVIGEIPTTLMLADRLSFANIPWQSLPEFVAPALTITALGAVESLLCGAVASNMTGTRLQANQELVAQGIGNFVIPFFGGVPATAAIARTSVGIKSGGQTRLVSIIHAFVLLLSMFLLAPIMQTIPLAALAGVLMVTAWRMNEWHSIRFIFNNRFKTDMLAFGITMLATITLDLTQAILIGSMMAGAVFLNKIASLEITLQSIDPSKMRERGFEVDENCQHVQVAYLTGPLFFAATGHFNEAFAELSETHALILSMRAVPLIDTSGLEALLRLNQKIQSQGGTLMLAGVHDNVRNMMERAGLVDALHADRFFWSSDQAIMAAQKNICLHCSKTEGNLT